MATDSFLIGEGKDVRACETVSHQEKTIQPTSNRPRVLMKFSHGTLHIASQIQAYAILVSGDGASCNWFSSMRKGELAALFHDGSANE